MQSQSSLLEMVKATQWEDAKLCKLRDEVKERKENGFMLDEDGVLRYEGRLCVPNVESVRRQILEEAHRIAYTIHSGTTKMYQDLRSVYWWDGMKRSVVDYVSHCLTCQQVKAEHQRPAGLLQQMEILEWKWERVIMDFVVGLPRSQKGHDSTWVIVDRLTKWAHFLPMKTMYSLSKYAQVYIDEIVRLHGVPLSIISDRGP